MKNTEALIQCEIVKYLQKTQIFAFSIPNEAAGGNKIRQMQMISMGLRSGVSDLEVWLPLPDNTDLIIYVEVKEPKKGKQSEKQRKFELRCIKTNKPYFIVFSVSDMQKIVENHIRQNWF